MSCHFRAIGILAVVGLALAGCGDEGSTAPTVQPTAAIVGCNAVTFCNRTYNLIRVPSPAGSNPPACQAGSAGVFGACGSVINDPCFDVTCAAGCVSTVIPAVKTCN